MARRHQTNKNMKNPMYKCRRGTNIILQALIPSAPACDHPGERCSQAVRGLALLALLVGFIHTASAAAEFLPVTLEQAASPTGPWSPAPVSSHHLSPDGSLVMPAQRDAEYWRLRVGQANLLNFTLGLPLGDGPAEATQIANNFLSQHAMTDPGAVGDAEGDSVDDPFVAWRSARLADVVIPIYDPAHDEGRTPAYMEDKVIVDGTMDPLSRPFRATPAPVDLNRGFIIVSLTENDFPIVTWGNHGRTMVEQLRERAGTAQIKPMLYGVELMVGESPEGNVLATLGTLLFKPNSALLNFTDYLGESFLDTDTGEAGRPSDFPITDIYETYDSYAAMKADYSTNEFFQLSRAQKREAARLDWLFVRGTPPPTLLVRYGEPSTNFFGRRVLGATLHTPDNERLAEVSVLAPDGLVISAFGAGGGGGAGLVHVQLEGGDQFFTLQVVGQNSEETTGSGGGVFTPGWHLVKIYRAGTTEDQRWYKQFQSLDFGGDGPGNYVGCGSCAWTMLMGWWDRKGVPVIFKPYLHGSGISGWQLGLPDAPAGNNYSVEAMMRDFRSQWVDPNYCNIVTGACGTPPDRMARGIDYFASLRNPYNLSYFPLIQEPLLGYGYQIKWTYFPKDGVNEFNTLARESLQKGYPSIVGLGDLVHYALAYGYYEWRYEVAPGVYPWWKAWMQCNWGDGGKEGPRYYNFNEKHFFATKCRFWQTHTEYETP